MRYQASRFALYLIPPYQVARQVADVHTILRKQFGFIAADQFQVHATIKGFFKKAERSLDPMVEQLEAIFADQDPIPVYFNGIDYNEIGICLDISKIGREANQMLIDFREKVVAVIRPFIATDCDFVEADLDNPFIPHITLAFRDIPIAMQGDILDFLQHTPLPTEPFMADRFHFLQFFSQDWNGRWEQTLTWKLLKSWHLASEQAE